jgi:hypothetical protein
MKDSDIFIKIKLRYYKHRLFVIWWMDVKVGLCVAMKEEI